MVSIIPWFSGRLLVWDATCSDTLAYSNLPAAVTEAGAVTLQAEKFFFFFKVFFFFGPQTKALKLGQHLKSLTLDENSHQYLLQKKNSVAVQQGNAASVVGSLPWASKMENVGI